MYVKCQHRKSEEECWPFVLLLVIPYSPPFFFLPFFSFENLIFSVSATNHQNNIWLFTHPPLPCNYVISWSGDLVMSHSFHSIPFMMHEHLKLLGKMEGGREGGRNIIHST